MDYLISDQLKQYEKSRRSSGYSDHTIERCLLTINMISRDMNIKKIGELTTDTLLAWGEMKRAGEFGRELSRSGLYACYNSVRSFLKFLDECDIEHEVNAKRIHCKPDYKERECLSASDIKKIIPHAPYDIGILIKLLFTAGMRIGEALELTIDDLRHDNTIHLDHSKWCESRTVIITSSLKQELTWLAKEGGYFFLDRKDRSKPLNRKLAYYYIKSAMKKAGFKDAYPHAERHGFATELLRNGAGLSEVRRMMGHKNITTTQIYEHLVIDDLKLAHARYLPVV